ncbi:MAG: universal stress protein [Chloroflexota bacterium]
MDVSSPYCNLLLATDGSKESRRAMAHGIYLAKALGTKLYILYVVDTHTTQSLGVHFSEGVHELRAEGQRVLDEAVRMAVDLGTAAEGILAEGVPGRVICKIATERQVDIIVIGATGKSGLQEILMGSVSGYVADHARQPVMIVRS